MLLSGAALPFYQLEFPVECATPEAAAAAELTLLPLPEGKKVAFSCRWDDSHERNLNMREVMAKYGVKGTFYLHDTQRKNFWKNVFPALHKDGFTIGNHTRSHRELALQTPNAIFFDILWWNMVLEHRSNQAVTGFVVPYSKVASPFFPGVPKLVGSLLRRAGMLGGADFQPDMYKLFGSEKGEYSGTRMLVPGAVNTSIPAFEKQLAAHLKAQPEYPHVTMGIHALHSDENLLVIGEIFKKYSGRADWWYCNENEFIAYSTLLHNCRISGKRTDGKTAYFTLTLPRPELLGSDVSLWGKCNGKIFPIPHRKQLPELIGLTDKNGRTAKFPGLNASVKTAGDKICFSVRNSGAALENVLLTLRLPPAFETEKIFVELKRIDREYFAEWTVRRRTGLDLSGRELCAVQMDFVRDGKAGRLWSWELKEHPAKALPYQLYFSKEEMSLADAVKLSTAAAVPAGFTAGRQENFLRNGVVRLIIPGRKNAKSGFTAVMEFEGGKKFELKGHLPAKII